MRNHPSLHSWSWCLSLISLSSFNYVLPKLYISWNDQTCDARTPKFSLQPEWCDRWQCVQRLRRLPMNYRSACQCLAFQWFFMWLGFLATSFRIESEDGIRRGRNFSTTARLQIRSEWSMDPNEIYLEVQNTPRRIFLGTRQRFDQDGFLARCSRKVVEPSRKICIICWVKQRYKIWIQSIIAKNCSRWWLTLLSYHWTTANGYHKASNARLAVSPLLFLEKHQTFGFRWNCKLAVGESIS